MTTISSCHIRPTTFPIKYAHAAGTPPLACSAPSECVLSISSATSAGTVAEHVYVTLYCCRDASRSRRAYRTSKSWLTRSNAKGMNDLQAARTLIPRKQSCSRHAAVDDCICKETHEADGSKPKGIPKRLFFFLTCRLAASKTTTTAKSEKKMFRRGRGGCYEREGRRASSCRSSYFAPKNEPLLRLAALVTAVAEVWRGYLPPQVSILGQPGQFFDVALHTLFCTGCRQWLGSWAPTTTSKYSRLGALHTTPRPKYGGFTALHKRTTATPKHGSTSGSPHCCCRITSG